MADCLLELAGNLRMDQLTSAEAKVWSELRQKGLRDFLIAATGGAIFSWFACQKLALPNRIMVTPGVSAFCGLWSADRTLTKYIDRILSLDGTRMQTELAVSLLRRYHDNPTIMNRLSKHFYAEKVYVDSSEIPKLRWTFRHSDYPLTIDVSKVDHSSNNYEPNQRRTVTKPTNSNNNEPNQRRMVTKPTNSRPKQPAQLLQKNTDVELVENPFECIFGTPVEVEETDDKGGSNIPRASRSNPTPKRHTHGSHKRHHHRRHRKHHLEEASEAVNSSTL